MWRNVMVWFVIAGMVNFLLPAHLFAGGEQVGTQKFVEPYAMTLEEGQQTHQALEGMQAKALAINGQQPGAAAARVLPPPAPRPGPASPFDVLLIEALFNRVITGLGHPIEGFTPLMFLAVFPGLRPADFDGVRAFSGVYKWVNGTLRFEMDQPGGPVHSAFDAITKEGMRTLIDNISSRLGISVDSQEAVRRILGILRTAVRPRPKDPGPAVRKPPVLPGKSRFIGVTPPPYITISKPVVPWILEGFPVDGGGIALEILIKNHPELEELLGGPPATPEEPQVPPLASVEAPTPKPPVHPGGSHFVISRLLRTVMIEGNGSPSTPRQEVLDSPEQVQEVNEQDSQEGPADGSFFRSSFWGIRLGEAAGPESFKHWSLRVIFGLYPDEEDDPTHDTAI